MKRHAFKKKTFISIMLSAFLVGGITVFAAYNNTGAVNEKAPDAVVAVAERTLQKFNIKLASYIYENQGIQCELSELMLGESFNLNYPAELTDEIKKSSNFNNYIKSSGDWLFLVMYKDEPVSSIAVNKNNFKHFGYSFPGFYDSLNTLLGSKKESEVKLLSIEPNMYFIDLDGNAVKIPFSEEVSYRKPQNLNTIMDSAKLCEVYKENCSISYKDIPLEKRQAGDEDLLSMYLEKYGE